MATLSPIQNDVPATVAPEVNKHFFSFVHDEGIMHGSEWCLRLPGDFSGTEIVRHALESASVVLIFIGKDSYSRQIGFPDALTSRTDLHQESDFLLALRESGYVALTTASSGDEGYHTVCLDLDPDLKAALQDLEGVREEARKEEFPEPTSVAISNARRLLHKLYDLSPQRYVVYPHG